MADSFEQEWMDLLRDVNDTLGQIEGGLRHLRTDHNAWLDGLKRSAVFSLLPADKLVAVILKLESVPARTGDVVIRQKDGGDYFYIIKSGTFTVSRREGPGEFRILAQLAEGDTFGEAALLSDEVRNASIVADVDGELLRLSRDNFITLVRNDLVPHVGLAEAEQQVQAGARYLDVRRDTAGSADRLPGALALPVDQLRARLSELDRGTPYIVVCNNGNLSDTAAFLLSQRGFHVSVLDGGLQAQH